MSDLELEQAAMAPRRWIKFCGAFQKQHSNDFSETLRPRTTRIIEDKVETLFIVPGGRYLVTAGRGISVWDLGYVSTVDCKLVASAGLEDLFFLLVVQATPDGKGLVILSTPYSYGYEKTIVSIFEIYPQSEVPRLTQIAHHDRFTSEEEEPAHLLPDILVYRVFHEDRIVFRVVDYRTNYSTCFLADVNVKMIDSDPDVKTFATKTAIIVFCNKEILIWAIPPLSPQPSDIPDHFLDNNPTRIPALFKIPFRTNKILSWMTISSWYCGSESVYFDVNYTDLKLRRFKIVIKPDLCDASLHFVKKKKENILNNLVKPFDPISDCNGYRICEDDLVYFWYDRSEEIWGVYAGLTSAPFTWDGKEALSPYVQHPVDLYVIQKLMIWEEYL